MPKFDVLDPNCIISSPYFLEASAGTGKTFAIEHIVTRLLLDPVLQIQGEELLVVTFTRAATRELKIRIRNNLKQALSSLKGDQPVLWPYLKSIESDEAKVWSIRKLEEALSLFDRISIFTIHGFCHQMLKRFPFEADIALEITFKETQDTASFIDQVLDFLRSGLESTYFHRFQVEKVFRKNGYDISELARQLIYLMEQEALFPDYYSYEEGLNHFKDQIDVFRKNLRIDKGFSEEFYELSKIFNGLSSNKDQDNFLKQVDLLEQCLKEEISEQMLWDQFLQYDILFLEKLSQSFLKKKSKLTFEDIKKNYSLFVLKEHLYPLLEEARDSKKILLRMAKACKESLLQDQKEIQSPDEILKWMHRSISRPLFCQKVQKFYKAAIIDEFQDTDPLQWDIFYKLFFYGRANFPLFLVGDPKQSIYGFRNADLPTYLKASRAFLPSQHLSLDTNYRSEPLLIEVLNRLFSLSPTWLSDDKAFIYELVKAREQTVDSVFGDGYGSVNCLVLATKKTPNKKVEEELLFSFIAQEIITLHKLGFSFGSFAILIRDRFQGQRLQVAFKKMKIPIEADQMVNLTETRAFSFLRQLIKVLGHIEDKNQMQKLLAHPLFGFVHQDLRLAHLDKKVLQAITKIKNLFILYDEQGFLMFWEAFLKTPFIDPDSSFEERLVALEDAQDYYDLMQLIEKLIEQHPILSHGVLENAIEQLATSSFEEKEGFKRRTNNEEDAVTMMTIHKSKGLEFEIVFALGVYVRSSSVPNFIKCQKQQKLMILDLESDYHQDLLKKKDEEKMRQLYVALTRAKKRVYFPVCFTEEEGLEFELSPIELFFKRVGLSLSKDSFLLAIEALSIEGLSIREIVASDFTGGYQEQADPPELHLPKVYNKQFPPFYIASYSSLLSGQGDKPIVPYLKLEDEPLIPSSAYMGNLFHKILEKFFERGLYIQGDKEALRALVLQEMSSISLKEVEEPIVNLLDQVLRVQLEEGGRLFSFKDIEPSNLVTEMEFLLIDERQPFKGIV
ncbi:MAG: UvrD-helicase domain-containing protein, partial [Chlamydiota bacterium]